MPSVETLALFSVAAIALLVIPGPAVIYIVTRSAAQGRRAGLASVAGIHVGTMVHVIAAVIGLSAIVAASAVAFTTIKVIGAGYLIWLGVSTLWASRRSPRTVAEGVSLPPIQNRSLRRVFVDGAVVNVLNPKVAIFFLAFVPQFVHAEDGAASTQLLVLGAVFIALGVLSDGTFALLGAAIGTRLQASARWQRRTQRASGVIYLGLGAVTAVAGGQHATSTP